MIELESEWTAKRIEIAVIERAVVALEKIAASLAAQVTVGGNPQPPPVCTGSGMPITMAVETVDNAPEIQAKCGICRKRVFPGEYRTAGGDVTPTHPYRPKETT